MVSTELWLEIHAPLLTVKRAQFRFVKKATVCPKRDSCVKTICCALCVQTVVKCSNEHFKYPHFRKNTDKNQCTKCQTAALKAVGH